MTPSKNPTPAPKNKLFRTSNDWWNNACVNYLHDPTDAICTGYLESAETLTQQVLETGIGQDTHVYPIAFLYRHYVELRLKEAIRYSARILRKDVTVPNDHHLRNLWHIAKRLLLEIEPRSDQRELRTAERIITDLDKIDPESVAFRYDRTTDGEPNLEGLYHINLRNLRDELHPLLDFLEGISCMLPEYLQAVYEMEAEERAAAYEAR